MWRLSLLIILFPTVFQCYSQLQVELFYNSNWKLTKKEFAHFKRVAEVDTTMGLFDGKFTDSLNESIIMTGEYDQGVKNGVFVFYYSNGQLEASGSYVNDIRIGKWEYYFENGQLKEKVIFDPVEKWNLARQTFRIHESFDLDGTAVIIKGNGTWTNDAIQQSPKTRADLNIRTSGSFKSGLMHGKWKTYTLPDKTPLVQEKYSNGKLVAATRAADIKKYGETGWKTFRTTETYILDDMNFDHLLSLESSSIKLAAGLGLDIQLKNRPMSYIHGEKEMYRLIGMNMRYPKIARSKNLSGTVYVRVTVGSDGKVIKVTISRSAHEVLDKEALRVVQLITLWKPAVFNGERIPSTITIPVNFNGIRTTTR